MAAELLGANNAATTVASGGYSSGASYLNVVSTSTGTGLAPFPSTGNFRVSIFNAVTGVLEVVLLVVAINSGTQFATTAEIDGNASAGDLVLCTITSGGMAAILAQMNQVLPFSSLPTTIPFAGARVKQSDGPYEWISNGSAWVPFWNGYQVTLPPQSGWTAEGSDPGTSHYTNGFGYLIGNSWNTGDSIGVNYRTAPSTPYAINARMVFDTSGITGQAYYGLGGFAGPSSLAGCLAGFRDSGGKYLVMVLVAVPTTPAVTFIIVNLTTDNSGATDVASQSKITFAGLTSLKDLVFQIQNNGTDLIFSISLDGQNFLEVYSEAITTHLADADNICWGAYKSGGSPLVCLYDWTVGT
jgi:hypothetical protein